MQPKFFILIILVLISSSCVNTAVKSYAIDFLEDAHWNQGKAEVQIYQAKIKRYGLTRKALVSMIFVKEPFDSKKMVKTNQKADFNVLKMNYIRKIPTGIYQYYEMASCFFQIPDGSLIKYSQSSQDGCGITYRQFISKEKASTLETFSYFDDQGYSRDSIDSQAVFYDSLPLYLRFYLDEPNRQINLLPTFLSNKYQKPGIVKADINITSQKVFKIDDQDFTDIYLLKLNYQDKEDLFVFRKKLPHTMLYWKMANGDTLTLAKDYFTSYWEKTKTEHDSMLKIDYDRKE